MTPNPSGGNIMTMTLEHAMRWQCIGQRLVDRLRPSSSGTSQIASVKRMKRYRKERRMAVRRLRQEGIDPLAFSLGYAVNVLWAEKDAGET